MRWWMGLGVVLSLWGAVCTAEQVTVTYTEPVVNTGVDPALAKTTIYWCPGATCENWRKAVDTPSDNGAGGDAKSIPIVVDLAQAVMPVTIRVKVTGTNVNGNEGLPGETTHTFN